MIQVRLCLGNLLEPVGDIPSQKVDGLVCVASTQRKDRKSNCSVLQCHPFGCSRRTAQEAFQRFLRIPSVSSEGPSGAYQLAVEWIADYARNTAGLTLIKTVEYVKGKPVVLIEWPGSQPELPRLVLNSHYDVVPVMQEHWDTDPFAAFKDSSSGRIYGRGTQDMKCVCVQYLAAVSRLRRAGFQPTRTVYLSFVPDEEIGGVDGALKFLESEEWTAIQPVGLALDEGLANPNDKFTVFYGERTPWWLMVRAEGATGHGSRFIKDTAIQKLMSVCNKALAFRKEQEDALGHSGGCSHAQAKKLGDVTTLNLTMLKAGVPLEMGDEGGTEDAYALNVIPNEALAGFDIRVSPETPLMDIKAHLDDWCREEGLSWKFADWTRPSYEHHVSSIDRNDNPWWGLLLVSLLSLASP